MFVYSGLCTTTISKSLRCINVLHFINFSLLSAFVMPVSINLTGIIASTSQWQQSSAEVAVSSKIVLGQHLARVVC